jgi:hypothetical protein
VAELVLQHAFTEGETHDEDRALAVAAAALAVQPGHSMHLDRLITQMRARDPTLPGFKGTLGRLLGACPVFVREVNAYGRDVCVRLNVGELKRAAGEGQAAAGEAAARVFRVLGGGGGGVNTRVARWKVRQHLVTRRRVHTRGGAGRKVERHPLSYGMHKPAAPHPRHHAGRPSNSATSWAPTRATH